MDFQQYLREEKNKNNKMTSKQKEYILSSKMYLERLDIDIKDVELDLIGKDKAKDIIEDIHEMKEEDFWEAYTHDW